MIGENKGENMREKGNGGVRERVGGLRGLCTLKTAGFGPRAPYADASVSEVVLAEF